MSKKTEMRFDARCKELAEYFVADEPDLVKAQVDDLADQIQDRIEDWLEARLDEARRASK